MKILFASILVAFTCASTLAADYKYHCEKKFFKTKQLSTQKCYDKDKRFGKAIAYNKKGVVIYEKELRTIAGHASVYFTYHPNGAICKAEWSSAPDAGIQWYKSSDEFDENGKLVHHSEQSYDDRLQLTVPYIVPGKDTVLR